MTDFDRNSSRVRGAQWHLKHSAGEDYLKQINGVGGEEFANKVKDLGILRDYIHDPQYLVSVGVGNGVEQSALQYLFPDAPAIGIDLSRAALRTARENLQKIDMESIGVEASGIQLPMADASVDGVVLSSILHEVFSYVPNSKEAWRLGIAEAFRVLKDGGCLFIRDFAAPQSNEPVQLKLNTTFARDFYEFFRQHYRRFESWDERFRGQMEERRIGDETDFPPASTEGIVTLPRRLAGEMLMHLRNGYNDFMHDLFDPNSEDAIHWKEINETYMVPGPSGVAMSPDEFIREVLKIGNEVLGEDAVSCVHNEVVARESTASSLSLQANVVAGGSDAQVFGSVTGKLTLIFRVQRQ